MLIEFNANTRTWSFERPFDSPLTLRPFFVRIPLSFVFPLVSMRVYQQYAGLVSKKDYGVVCVRDGTLQKKSAKF